MRLQFASIFLMMASLTLVPALSPASTTYIGNAGDGYFIPGKGFVLTDFLAEDLEKPWIGGDIDPAIQRQYDGQDSMLKFALKGDKTTETAFLRKLSDAQQIRPHFGEYLLGVLQLQVWLPYIESLNLIPLEQSDTWRPPQDWPRVQLAVRLREFIFADRYLWMGLSVESRVGLLVHEALSALTIPTCVKYSSNPFDHPCELYEQRSTRIRKMTAALFREEGSDRRQEFIYLSLPPSSLELPEASSFEIRIDAYCAPGFEQYAFRVIRGDFPACPRIFPKCSAP